MKKHFIGIIESTRHRNTDNVENTYLHLNIDRNKGIETVPDMNINITRLNSEKGKHFNHFFNNGYGGVTFKITVIIRSKDVWNNKKVFDVLHKWYVNMTPLYVISESVDFKNGTYIMSNNAKRLQNYRESSVWELEFTTYTPLSVFKFKNNNKGVKRAILRNKKKAKKNATVYSKFSKCNYKNIKYSKKKKTVKCVKYMQQILYKKHFLSKKSLIDGWFGSTTKTALKKYQKKNKKLKATGKLDKNTFKTLCKG